jgi:general L-amino acid transport system permease protein
MATVPDSLPAEALPPPRRETGLAGWVRANLFSNWYNSALTLLVGGLAALVLWYGLSWLLIDADFTVISTLGGLLLIGQYNAESACSGQNCFWRPQVALMMVTLLLGMTWVVAGGGIARRIAIMVVVVISLFAFLPYSLERMGWDVRLLLLANIPSLLVGWALARYTPLGSWRWVATISVLAFLLTLVLLRGLSGVPGLQPVSVLHWGGLMLNLLLAVAGIVASFPIGIALALGRRSRLPVVKLLCVVFIEVFRGVPLITLLFMSQVLVPLAFPANFPLNSVLRAAIIITLFSAAYMAENIRGGLQALDPGQEEAARALGLPQWQTTMFISLPQAIRNVIPTIVGQFIALFKDTSLVYIIGMLDIVELSRKFATTYVENGALPYLDNVRELFIFLALVFWVFTYGMSYVSGKVEEHLGVGVR